ncbi:hypothetical protein PV327_008522 [Microctonus hyperodae]|uniref:Gamma-taxilin n=1 Tax=Microctonus hyperodae TaxID=165561 RepID=A0AA39KHN5_MICHY|nr:hypothetical protein PV327_008522 [Microctonus hyperodae]
MDFDKESIEVLDAVLKNAPPISNEDSIVQTKKHSKLKKKDSTFLYGAEMADILKSSQSPEEKLKAVCDKYSETLHANRKLMIANKMAEGRIVKLQQENEQCQQQRSKAVLTRSRLENLCRELQKLNKAQKEEIDLKLRLEEEKRKEISATFQSAFAEMNTLTNQNTEKNTKMREENLEMREKIKYVRERVELSEQQLEKVRQRAQLELQLADARMATVKMEMTAEKESLLKEKQQLLLQLTEYQVRISELQATEVGLRSQISMYTEKYDDFQNALTKSNELFSGFNEEMEKMSKKILKLEKETTLWKQRWEKSHAALLEMASDKQTRDTEMEKLTHKLSLLQELCKAFQRERAELLAQLRTVNGTVTTLSTTDNLKIHNIDGEKIKELSADSQQFNDDLSLLQNSLDEMSGEKTKKSEILTVIERENNLSGFQSIENDSDVGINTELFAQASDVNKISEDNNIIESFVKKCNFHEMNNEKQNSEEIKIPMDEVKQLERRSTSLVDDNKLNDCNMIHPNESAPTPTIHEKQIICDNAQCTRSDQFCEKECINDKVNNLVTTLNQIELIAQECAQNENVEEKINYPIIASTHEHMENKSNNKICAVMDDKKGDITKQNNSNSMRKSGGKKKKK